MFKQIKTRLDRLESTLRNSFGDDISTPKGRRAAFWHFQLMDHAFLRVLWTNLYQVAPDVWRSNQPSPRRLARYKRMGIKSILSLRGSKPKSHHLFEQEACEQLGMALHTISINARKAPPRNRLIELLDFFDQIEKPFLMHCKSGADRAGLASALYLIHAEGKSPAEAAGQLHWRFMHLRNAPTGIMDELVDLYALDTAQEPISLRHWIETRYDPTLLTRSFAERYPKAGSQ